MNLTTSVRNAIRAFEEKESKLQKTPVAERTLAALTDLGEVGKKIFRVVNRAETSGVLAFIIACWEGEQDEPIGYCPPLPEMDVWMRRFDDKYSAEAPLIYRTLAGVCKKMEALRVDPEVGMQGLKWGLTLWVHSESHFTEFERYIIASGGSRFPGSPRK